MHSLNLEKLELLCRTDFGIKKHSQRVFKEQLGYNKRLPIKFLLKSDLLKIETFAEKRLGSTGSKTLKTLQFENIDFKKKNKSYVGSRHERLLPVRGQRTKTNAKTNRKKRKN